MVGFVTAETFNDINKEVCDVLMLNFVDLSKMCSLRLLMILHESLSEARGVGFEPFLHGRGVIRCC